MIHIYMYIKIKPVGNFYFINAVIMSIHIQLLDLKEVQLSIVMQMTSIFSIKGKNTIFDKADIWQK